MGVPVIRIVRDGLKYFLLGFLLSAFLARGNAEIIVSGGALRIDLDRVAWLGLSVVAPPLSGGNFPFASGSASSTESADPFLAEIKLAFNVPEFGSEMETTGCRNRASSSLLSFVTGCARNSICLFKALDLIFSLSNSASINFFAW